ncbi:GrpE protein HSP-70 cofactor [Mycolicibacterium phlei]|uniref:Protein GrpE n=1 Tax=Mycolicibacterium phlei DSM 43239 = CCUG 21000 TaxID=1226750 RepID=A0A5N5VCQ3_MYCPH|nr:nucleotide exchange factor GrpE [Mycolicibacterium phlei]VEG11583.1 GrpE protein HSP-70 cofactor [Mycobacteroides chelonae]AMO63489.1 Protein GrpE [Mycolicibacterium phlei]EID14496.1 GrpE protein HSP-70 cofactor [Mycolicibacterium phlei RIVM601174]KAB7759665.1 heat shock protein GrpE [Mycolicibacterium phlei DSM 43239 = CCUG 21000]KXW63065.1 heat shock protein GrpE [Mycolicibacterium phlei DSM 43070]
MTDNDSHEPVTVTDKRRIDPVTGEVRDPNAQSSGTASGPSESGDPAPAAPAGQAEGGEAADKAAELLADLQRVQAEFANYRKRALREQQAAADRSKASVLTELLPVLDDLDRARSHGDLESGPFKAVADKLTGILEGLGLSAFGAEGEDFDPALHEAVQHEGDGTHPVIGTVMRRGYRVGETVVRHALVGVVDTVPDDDSGAGADAQQEEAPEQPEQQPPAGEAG